MANPSSGHQSNDRSLENRQFLSVSAGCGGFPVNVAVGWAVRLLYRAGMMSLCWVRESKLVFAADDFEALFVTEAWCRATGAVVAAALRTSAQQRDPIPW
jgi:hypothetical protein